MTATTTPAATATAVPPASRAGRGRLAEDAVTMVWRNLLNIRRTPQLLVFSTVQPVIFVLMFRYVFGGAIPIPGVPYVDYLMPGIFAQTVAFGAITTGVGLAEDLSKGLIERFRSLPIARSAVLIGRTVADLCRNVFVQTLMVGVGFLVDYRIHGGVPRFMLGMLLLLGFGFALSWIFATVGLMLGDAETTQAAAFPVMAPLVFASNAFVPVAAMPGWLQAWANNQPLSVVIAAMRRLSLSDAQAAALHLTDSTFSYVAKAVAWIVVIVAVFAPIAVSRYRKVA